MARPISVLELTRNERLKLIRRVHDCRVAKRHSLRADIVLLRGRGIREVDVARQLHTSVTTVSRWSRRFACGRLEGLEDEPGRGRKTSLPRQAVKTVIAKVNRPPPGSLRWTVRSMAEAAGISPSSVYRIWRDNWVKPEPVTVSRSVDDPAPKPEFWDVIGLYLNPPERVLVLCCDKKSQCHPLGRKRGGLPLKMGEIGRRTGDYRKRGAMSLVATLDQLDGNLVARAESGHSHGEWLRFLRKLDRETPKGLNLHLLQDNYCTQRHKVVRHWVARHPRFYVHFTRPGSSWVDLVEQFLGGLTEDVIGADSLGNVRELIRDIGGSRTAWSRNPEPCRWQADRAEMLRKVQRCKQPPR